ncbi:beta-1,4-galactosyltransferase galt-1-like [Leptodactylus fuscus]|uniref:beta-1,4-galactosyltransferase galt-1-like n=1 Tax=Leptodactylus fuscus TaxID=238119 RepID=UPI003F4EDA99
MIRSKKRLFFSCLLFVSLFIMFFCLRQPQASSINSNSDHLNIVTGPFIALKDNKTFIISSYYDARQSNLIRIVAIVHKTVEKLYCLFYCKRKDNLQIQTANAEIDIVMDRFGFPFETANLLCENPSECDYDYMSVHTNNSGDERQIPAFKITKNFVRSFSVNFTVCISALFGDYSNALQVIQAIEMYKLLGASRVTVYNNSCHDNVDKVLRHYIQDGLVDVVPWPVDKFLKTSREWHYGRRLDTEIGYYAQVAALNDCIYRNMYSSKFVLLNDFDEFIFPVKDRDWSSLMRSLQQRYPETSVFRFENYIFPSINATGFNPWSQVPGINILQYTYREPNDGTRGKKMIINPRKVIQTSVHGVLKSIGRTTDVSREDAFLYHCKHKRNMEIPDKDLIKDDILFRFNMSLVPNIDRVVEKLF